MNLNQPAGSSILTRLSQPAFLLNIPFSLETRVANNATMMKLGPQGRRVNRQRLLEQWQMLYHHMSARALVYLIPSQQGLQDQTFVANLAVLPPHTQRPLALISKFRAKARHGETKSGVRFFESAGFKTVVAPFHFEGEADLKYLRHTIYFGGYGLRSSLKAQAWMKDKHGFQIIPIPLMDPHLYHLDCVLHVLARDRIMLATASLPAETVKAAARKAEILDVPLDLAYRGATNIARLGNQLLCDSSLPQLKRGDSLYSVERKKRRFLEKLAGEQGLEAVFFNMSEFYKSGAMLSCLVLPLNYPHLR